MVHAKPMVYAAIPTTVFGIKKTYWMYLRETFWLCLVVMVRMYICRAANRSAASYFSSGPNRSSTTSLQLYKGEGRGQTLVKIKEPVSGFHLSGEQVTQPRVPH